MLNFTSWQDYVFFVGSFLFFIALLPAVRSDQKPPLSSCLLTFSVLITFAFADWTLHLYLAASMTLLTIAAWGMLAYQQFRNTYDWAFCPGLDQKWRARRRSPGYYDFWFILIWRLDIPDDEPISHGY